MKLAFQKVKDRSVAEDICQEVFYNLYKLGDKLDVSDEGRLFSLIRTATMNKIRDYNKRAHMRHEIPSDEKIEIGFGGCRDISLEARILKMEEQEYFRLVLQRLRDVNKMNYEILIKVRYLDIPPELVAEEYGITKNNLHNRIYRAKLWIEAEMTRIYKG